MCVIQQSFNTFNLSMQDQPDIVFFTRPPLALERNIRAVLCNPSAMPLLTRSSCDDSLCGPSSTGISVRRGPLLLSSSNSRGSSLGRRHSQSLPLCVGHRGILQSSEECGLGCGAFGTGLLNGGVGSRGSRLGLLSVLAEHILESKTRCNQLLKTAAGSFIC